MTAPRQILPNKISLVTRRTSQRQFLLKPSEQVNNILLYCMGYASIKYNIKIHAFCFLSNHYHIIQTDTQGRLPEFQHWMNKNIAKCINALHGRWENLWAPGSYNAVGLDNSLDNDLYKSNEDVLDKMVYLLTNPVAAGLVKHSYLWPGLWSSPQHIGKNAIIVKRPKIFFDPKGNLPETIRIELVPPPCFEDMPVEEFSSLLRNNIQEKEKEIQNKLEAENRTFIGRTGIMAQSWKGYPSSREPRRTLNPQIACKNKYQRIKLLKRLQTFFIEYREAWKKFCKGIKNVIFPAGTYKMRVVYNVNCKTSP